MKPLALLSAMGGLIGWAAAFASVYALHGLGCARGWDEVDLGPLSLQRAVLVLGWAAWTALLAAWVWRVRRRGLRAGLSRPEPPAALVLRLAEVSAWVGLLATVVSLMPVATHALCL